MGAKTFFQTKLSTTSKLPADSIASSTSVTSASTDAEIPSAKAVYDYVEGKVSVIESALHELNSGSGV